MFIHDMKSTLSIAPFENNERITFYGDSITHGGGYLSLLQLFFATRHPELKLLIKNAGVGGASLKSLGAMGWKEAIAAKSNRVFMMFGMNDIGRDLYFASNDRNIYMERKRYLNDFRDNLIVNIERIAESGAELVLMTPTPYNQYSRVIKTENLPLCNEGLTQCAEIVNCIAQQYKVPCIDLHTPITKIFKSYPYLDWPEDRVHPNLTGCYIIMYYILKGLFETGCTTSIDINTNTRTCNCKNCMTEILDCAETKLVCSYQPFSLPFPTDDDYDRAGKFVNLDEINQDVLTVRGLFPGKYSLYISDEHVWTGSSCDLSTGINIARLKTPQMQKAEKIRDIIERKKKREYCLRNIFRAEWLIGADIKMSDDTAVKAKIQYLLETLPSRDHHKTLFSKYLRLKPYQLLAEQKLNFICDELLSSHNYDCYNINIFFEA